MAYFTFTFTTAWPEYDIDEFDIYPEISRGNPRRQSGGAAQDPTKEYFRMIIRLTVSRELREITGITISDAAALTTSSGVKASLNGGTVMVWSPPSGYGDWRVTGHKASKIAGQGSKMIREVYTLTSKQDDWTEVDWS